MRRGERFGEVLAGAVTGEDMAGGVESGEGGAVAVEAGGLDDDGLLPAEAEPGEVLERGGGEPGAAAGGIEVVDTQEKASAGGARAGGGEGEGAGGAEVQAAGGRGGEAAEVGAGGGEHGARSDGRKGER